MKLSTKIVATSLFVFTTATVAYYPQIESLANRPVFTDIKPIEQNQAGIEVVFVLDTTGSMSGMIEAAKEKIWSIASTMASAQNVNQIKVGLVAYRDRGDEYITRTFDLSEDLDSIYASLMDFKANGGGDGPESVNEALYTAVNNISWSSNKHTYKTIFLVGDAPPHMDYQDDVKYPESIKAAQQNNIVVNTIQCGNSGLTQRLWQDIAHLAQGDYLQVDQTGSAVAIATPYDKELAKLSSKLDETKLYYGDEETKVTQAKKLAATRKLERDSSLESRARRAEFNASKGGKKSFLGEGELVDDVSSGRIDVDSIEKEHLPEPMQAMAPDEIKQVVEEKSAARQALNQQIGELSKKRADYLRKEMEKTGKEKTSLSYKIYNTVKAQAESKGIVYDSDAPKY